LKVQNGKTSLPIASAQIGSLQMLDWMMLYLEIQLGVQKLLKRPIQLIKKKSGSFLEETRQYIVWRKIDTKQDPNKIGSQILDIWNERVSAVREKFKNLRTVVLIKSNDLSEVVVFEFETIRYDNELFSWEWNKNKNLQGYNKKNKDHCFTWQPHGSQFTIIEDVPSKRLIIKVKQPPILNKENVLKTIGFDKSWITVTQKND
jgi:hypothetical protein